MELVIGSLGFVVVGTILIGLGIRVQDRLAIVTGSAIVAIGLYTLFRL